MEKKIPKNVGKIEYFIIKMLIPWKKGISILFQELSQKNWFFVKFFFNLKRCGRIFQSGLIRFQCDTVLNSFIPQIFVINYVITMAIISIYIAYKSILLMWCTQNAKRSSCFDLNMVHITKAKTERTREKKKSVKSERMSTSMRMNLAHDTTRFVRNSKRTIILCSHSSFFCFFDSLFCGNVCWWVYWFLAGKRVWAAVRYFGSLYSVVRLQNLDQ